MCIASHGEYFEGDWSLNVSINKIPFWGVLLVCLYCTVFNPLKPLNMKHRWFELSHNIFFVINNFSDICWHSKLGSFLVLPQLTLTFLQRLKMEILETINTLTLQIRKQTHQGRRTKLRSLDFSPDQQIVLSNIKVNFWLGQGEIRYSVVTSYLKV